MKLIIVNNRNLSEKFLNFHSSLYKNEPYWIRPLDKDIEDVFNFKKNKHLVKGECIRWILEKDQIVIGRIAAFINQNTSYKNYKQPTGGIGFFDCINNQRAANLLFDASKKWLKEKGMEAMDGPINFGERDKWWGLLTKGYNQEPNYQCNYNFPYYKELFENYGFKNYFDQFTFSRKILDPLNHRLEYKAEIIKKDSDYTFEHIKTNNLEKYIKDIVDIYNKAWVNHSGVPIMTLEKGKTLLRQLKPIIDERLIWLGYYKKEPIAFYVNIPDVNQLIKNISGKLDFIGKIKFIFNKYFKKDQKMLGVLFGVVPEHQGKGVDGAIIIAASNTLYKLTTKYPVTEIKGIGDFNKKMILVLKQVGGDIIKTHTTYRYLFDREKPFERMKPIE